MKTPAMKWTAAALLLFAGISTGRAQNLVTNGDFETGNFGGWTTSGSTVKIDSAPGDVIAGSHSAHLTYDQTGNEDALLSQVVTVTPGLVYILQFSAKSTDGGAQCTANVSDANGKPLLITYFSTSFAASPNPAAFKATTPTVTINFSYQPLNFNSNIPSPTLLIDNVSLTPAHFSNPGQYTGKMTQTLSFTEVLLTQVYVRNVVARIDPSGRMVLALKNDIHYPMVGLVQDSGMLSFNLGPVLTTSMSGTTLNFTAEDYSDSSSNLNLQGPFPLLIKNSYQFTLKRTGS